MYALLAVSGLLHYVEESLSMYLAPHTVRMVYHSGANCMLMGESYLQLWIVLTVVSCTYSCQLYILIQIISWCAKGGIPWGTLGGENLYNIHVNGGKLWTLLLLGFYYASIIGSCAKKTVFMILRALRKAIDSALMTLTFSATFVRWYVVKKSALARIELVTLFRLLHTL